MVTAVVGEVTLSGLVSESLPSNGTGYRCLSISKIGVLARPARCRGYTPVIPHNHDGKVLAEAVLEFKRCLAISTSRVCVHEAIIVTAVVGEVTMLMALGTGV